MLLLTAATDCGRPCGVKILRICIKLDLQTNSTDGRAGRLRRRPIGATWRSSLARCLPPPGLYKSNAGVTAPRPFGLNVSQLSRTSSVSGRRGPAQGHSVNNSGRGAGCLLSHLPTNRSSSWRFAPSQPSWTDTTAEMFPAARCTLRGLCPPNYI